MSPIGMALLLVALLGLFTWSANRRWRLMMIGTGERRWDRVADRLRATFRFAFAQERMRRYWWAGIAHSCIFLGFLVLLLRSIILFTRGFDADSNLWLFDPHTPIGAIYALLKDVFIVLVISGTLIFSYYRLVSRPPRLSKGIEGVIILAIILVMMVADIVYEGAWINLTARQNNELVNFYGFEPVGSMAAIILRGADGGTLNVLAHLGFWTHTSLVLIFLNLLPYTKHFHVITAIPNVFLQNLEPAGRLVKIDDIEGKVEREETLGIKRIDQFSWKSILDLYTCTECGRCSDYCPATNTGKKLSPKHFTIDLRNFLYEHQDELIAGSAASNSPSSAPGRDGAPGVPADGEGEDAPECRKDLVGGVIDPEVLWACTSCRACEVECPVFISYVDKIVDMRRYLVQERGEFPNELQTAFRSLESSMNPWGFAPDERAAWAEGLDVPLMSEKSDVEYLFWVGCAPSYDDRAKKTTRATAQLLQQAGVSFAILGSEEQCTGDPARRAGNEFLFQMMAEANCEILNGYNVTKIVTTCPHCYNTLRNEYPDFGGNYQLIHHTELLARLVREGKLVPKNPVQTRVVYHDSCYLGRYHDIYDPPRELLRSIPGLQLTEPAQTRDRGTCCGAGGAQMFKEEEPGDARVNHLRTDQLLATDPHVITSACPFCMRMLTDGLADRDREDVRQTDIAELLLESVGTDIKQQAPAGVS